MCKIAGLCLIALPDASSDLVTGSIYNTPLFPQGVVNQTLITSNNPSSPYCGSCARANTTAEKLAASAAERGYENK